MRPLFRYFDKTETGPSGYRKRKGYSIQQELGHHPFVGSNGTNRKDEEYGMSSFVSAQQCGGTHDDNRSEKSTFPLTTIRKTIEVDISR
jgi:hypothetical protein